LAANIMASYSKSPEFPVIIEVMNGSSTRRTIDRLSLNLDQLKI
jgi:hypothetical protein